MIQIRRLTAIIAADVAGHSRLMSADEEGTHERLKALLRPYPTDKNDRIADQPARDGNVKNNDPSLTELLAGAS